MAERGAPKGNKNRETHGIVTLRNRVKRRVRKGRSFIDRRSHSGRNALEAQAGLIEDLGGADHVSTAEKIMCELIGRDLYMLDEVDRRIQHTCKKTPQAKNNPRTLHRLYSYRAPIVSNIGKHNGHAPRGQGRDAVMTSTSSGGALETPFTESGGCSDTVSSEVGRCANPLCHEILEPKKKHAPRKLYCGDKCRQDAWAIGKVSRLLKDHSDAEALKVIRAISCPTEALRVETYFLGKNST